MMLGHPGHPAGSSSATRSRPRCATCRPSCSTNRASSESRRWSRPAAQHRQLRHRRRRARPEGARRSEIGGASDGRRGHSPRLHARPQARAAPPRHRWSSTPPIPWRRAAAIGGAAQAGRPGDALASSSRTTGRRAAARCPGAALVQPGTPERRVHRARASSASCLSLTMVLITSHVDRAGAGAGHPRAAHRHARSTRPA